MRRFKKLIASRYFWIIFLLWGGFWESVSSGLFAFRYVNQVIGERNEAVGKYNLALVSDNKLILTYSAHVFRGQRSNYRYPKGERTPMDLVTEAPKRWSSVDLTNPPKRCDPKILATPPPEMHATSNKEVPIFATRQIYHLESLGGDHPVSVHVYQQTVSFVVIVRDKNISNDIVVIKCFPPRRRYQTKWALLAKGIAYPIAFVLDTFTSPLQFLYVIGIG